MYIKNDKFDEDISLYVLNRILELMEARCINYSNLADLSGIPQSTISTWFLKNHAPPVDKLSMICQALGVTMADFFSRKGLPKKYIVSKEDHIHLRKWHGLTRSHQLLVDSLIDEFLL